MFRVSLKILFYRVSFLFYWVRIQSVLSSVYRLSQFLIHDG